MNPALTTLANPLLSFPLTGGRAVEKSVDSSSDSSHIAQLTRRLAVGDEAALREFHEQYFDRLYRFLLVASHGQEQESQEALQHTLLRLVRYVRVFESEEVFWDWLKAVARSAARDGNRKQKRYSALLQRFAFQLIKPERDRDEESRFAALLEESLAELTPEDRRLLEAKYIEGFTVKELCAQNGMTEKGIESRLDRLRRAVRGRIMKRLIP
jgi:RNA polymerase sigma factor (sigma-70 family)